MASYMRAFNRTSVTEGLKSLKSEEIDAFIYDATILEYWTSRDDGCKLKTVGNLYAMTGYGIGFPKGSRWLPKVNSRILNYQKNGKFHRWKQFWLSGTCMKVAVLGNTNKTLGVKNFISAFILLICGMLLCGIIFLLEHVFYRYIWERIKISDRYGCCGLAVIKPSLKIVTEEQTTLERAVELQHRLKMLGGCQNANCLYEKYRNQQEIAKLSRHLRFLIDDIRDKNEILNTHYCRTSQTNKPALPSSASAAQQYQANSTAQCTVIKIPRASWSNENKFKNDLSYKPKATTPRVYGVSRERQTLSESKATRSGQLSVGQPCLQRCVGANEKQTDTEKRTPASDNSEKLNQTGECVEKESVL